MQSLKLRIQGRRVLEVGAAPDTAINTSRKRAWRGLTAAAGALALVAAMSMGGANEAKAFCVASIIIGPDNCTDNGPGGPSFDGFADIYIGAANGSANGNNGLGGGNTIQIGNIGIGLANASGNGNIVFNNPGNAGDAFNLSILNTQLGIANGSGNGNILFSNGADATSISVLNFQAGIANGAGNAFVLLADDPEDDATSVQIGNDYFGILNGSLNGINIGTGSSTVVQIENFGKGVGNFSGNANVIGDCNFTSFSEFEGGHRIRTFRRPAKGSPKRTARLVALFATRPAIPRQLSSRTPPSAMRTAPATPTILAEAMPSSISSTTSCSATSMPSATAMAAASAPMPTSPATS